MFIFIFLIIISRFASFFSEMKQNFTSRFAKICFFWNETKSCLLLCKDTCQVLPPALPPSQPLTFPFPDSPIWNWFVNFKWLDSCDVDDSGDDDCHDDSADDDENLHRASIKLLDRGDGCYDDDNDEDCVTMTMMTMLWWWWW